MFAGFMFGRLQITDPIPVWWSSGCSPTPASPSLSSLSLNPASVTGGNSSTGTVTFSGVAPAGSQVSLSSSDMSVARGPTSVTVAAGATGATFAISTSVVTTSTTVTISATYAGVTNTSPLTAT